MKIYCSELETSNILRGQASPGHSLPAGAPEARLPSPGAGCAGRTPLHTHERPRRPGATLPPGVGAPRARPAPPLPRRLTETVAPGPGVCLRRAALSAGNKKPFSTTQGCPPGQGPSQVNTSARIERTHEGTVPSCVRLRGGSTSARHSTVSAREPRLTNASSEQAENHCVFPEESKGLKGVLSEHAICSHSDTIVASSGLRQEQGTDHLGRSLLI